MKSGKALVVGGSLGGLLAANLLRSIGWSVQVYERSGDDLVSRGAGIGTHEELFDVLRRVGITVDDSIGVVPDGRMCLDADGSVVLEIERNRVLSSWSRLYRAIKDAFPVIDYHFGKTLQSFAETADGVTAVFSDGTRAEGDLLVAADGSRSTVRAQLFPDLQPRYAGYVCWRGLVDEAAMPPELHAQMFHRAVMCMPEGELMTAYPVPGPDNDVRPGHRSYNYVWYHPTDGGAALRALLTDGAGHHHENGIPPPLIRPEVIRDIRAVARRVLAPQMVAILELTRQPFFQPIYDLESPCIGRGRVALLGDAAFVARPHVGMGVTKAGLDAECLVDALVAARNDVPAALAVYDREQREFGRLAVARGRHVGGHLEAQLSKPREQRNARELHQDPAVIMRESGASLRDVPELIAHVRARRQRRDEGRLLQG